MERSYFYLKQEKRGRQSCDHVFEEAFLIRVGDKSKEAVTINLVCRALNIYGGSTLFIKSVSASVLLLRQLENKY